MQVTELQVQRSLAALTAAGRGPAQVEIGDVSPSLTAPSVPDVSATPTEVPPSDLSHQAAETSVDSGPGRLPEGLVEQLTETPPIRTDRVELARRQLENDAPPTAEALAQRMVGRLVCDRLR